MRGDKTIIVIDRGRKMGRGSVTDRQQSMEDARGRVCTRDPHHEIGTEDPLSRRYSYYTSTTIDLVP